MYLTRAELTVEVLTSNNSLFTLKPHYVSIAKYNWEINWLCFETDIFSSHLNPGALTPQMTD